MPRRDDVVLNQFGTPVADAIVTVCQDSATGIPCSPLASIFQDDALSIPQVNPLITDADGNYHFYAAVGEYQIQISGVGIPPITYKDQLIPSSPVGLVTFVGLTMPAEFSVSGSPITSSGTFAVTKVTEAANTGYFGPVSGAPAQPTFRIINNLDLPSGIQQGTIPYDLLVSQVGQPANGGKVFLLTFVRTVVFPGNFSGSVGTVGTNPTSTATYTIKKNGSSVGTIVVSTGGVVTFTSSGGLAVTFNSGDRMEIDAPTPQDATLADIATTLSGTR